MAVWRTTAVGHLAYLDLDLDIRPTVINFSDKRMVVRIIILIKISGQNTGFKTEVYASSESFAGSGVSVILTAVSFSTVDKGKKRANV